MLTIWSNQWQAPEARLSSLETGLREQGAVVRRGGDFDRWDLEVRGGIFGAVRTRMAIEEHGSGQQLVRFRSWPKVAFPALNLMLLFVLVAIVAAISQVWLAATVLGSIGVMLAVRAFGDCAAAMVSFLYTLKGEAKGNTDTPLASVKRGGELTLSDSNALQGGHAE
jgi:hypothetical protein